MIKTISGTKLYTANELLKKFTGKFIDTYPHHHEFWNDKINRYETVWEVRGTSRTVRENYETPQEVLNYAN